LGQADVCFLPVESRKYLHAKAGASTVFALQVFLPSHSEVNRKQKPFKLFIKKMYLQMQLLLSPVSEKRGVNAPDRLVKSSEISTQYYFVPLEVSNLINKELGSEPSLSFSGISCVPDI